MTDTPWLHEPNAKVWQDESTGYTCGIARAKHSGALLGYVGVTKAHRAAGFRYEHPLLDNIEVHGGLTYSDADTPPAVASELGNVMDGLWVFGYDTCHAFDVMPKLYKHAGMEGGTYRTFDYCMAQCTSLAKQLFDLHHAISR